MDFPRSIVYNYIVSDNKPTSSIIYRYELPASTSTIDLPVGGIVREFAINHHGVPCVWVQFDPDQGATESRMFQVVATGETVPPDYKYIDTIAHANSGALVLHLFEQTV